MYHYTTPAVLLAHVLVQVPPQILGHVGPTVPVINCREASIGRQEKLIFHVWPVPLYLRIVMTRKTVVKTRMANKQKIDTIFSKIRSTAEQNIDYFLDISPKNKNEHRLFFDILPILYDSVSLRVQKHYRYNIIRNMIVIPLNSYATDTM